MLQKKLKLTKLNTQVIKNSSAVDESRFKIDYKNLLNSAQYEAASAVEGAYLIIAGAGTGKTRTLVYRVARLIESGYAPESILLLTFTRKAATEMMNRASLVLDERCSKINGGTFHSFANLTLRKYAKAAGLNSSFTILDQSDTEDVINLLRSQAGVISKDKRFPNKQTLYTIFSLQVNTNRSIEDIVKANYPHFIDQLDRIIELQKVFTHYKSINSLLDYDDLLVYLLNFLNDLNAGTKSMLSKIRFVMVDEYQDTNNLQADIIKGLCQLNNNIMVVGDDSQSIYSFRGANFKNIMKFPKLFDDVKIIKLEENFRSTQPILDFANKVIDESTEKFTKVLYTHRTGGLLPIVVAANDENMQSRYIIEKILELREEGVSLNDIAVLFRSSFFSFDLEIELTKANIPFVKFGGMKFIETAHVKDVLAFLRIAANPKDIISWYRVLLLHEGIGPKTAKLVLDKLTNGLVSIKKSPADFESDKHISKLLSLFELLYKIHTGKNSPSDKLDLILQYYYPLFKNKYDDFNKRSKDLEIFQSIALKYASLDSLLADMAIEPMIDSIVDVDEEDKDDEILTLSTIHSAKGLEWHSVFVIDLIEGFFPSSRSIESVESIEEERRLMYVASTRAKNDLIITYPMNIFDRFEGVTISKPSRFISSLDNSVAEGFILEE